LEGGTLFISRNVNVFSWLENAFEDCGFYGVIPISLDRDALACKLNQLKPKYVFIHSEFWSCVTPFMAGRLHDNFPELNISVVNFCNFPDSLAVRFIFHGAKSYLDVNEGVKEFKKGLNIIKTGKVYYSPGVDWQINELDEIKKLKNYTTDREWQVLFLLCNGFIIKEIEFWLEVSERTVETHINSLFKIFDVAHKLDLAKKAEKLKWVNKKELVFNGDNLKIPKNPLKKIIKNPPAHGGGRLIRRFAVG
jgi:DNA-binding CsgD family transcriptional regulator